MSAGDGSHYQVIAVSDMFDGMSRVKKQQAIYAPLMDKIAANEIHALHQGFYRSRVEA